jgi:hypothetical protein
MHLRLGLAKVDQPPIRLTGQWIDILLPQKPDIVGLLQLLDRARIVVPIPPEVHADRPGVLVGAMHRLHLPFPAQLHRNLRSSDA